MRPYLRTAIVIVCWAAICYEIECRSLEKREVAGAASLSPNHHQSPTSDDIFRDKRKVDVKFGVKNAILGFVFNPENTKFSWETTAKPVSVGPTTTEDIVIFEKNKPVSLEIPDQLFGSSFALVTNLSNTVGDFMINSALRAQRLLESMRPFLRTVFGAKGIVIEASTDKPIFSDPDATK